MLGEFLRDVLDVEQHGLYWTLSIDRDCHTSDGLSGYRFQSSSGLRLRKWLGEGENVLRVRSSQ